MQHRSVFATIVVVAIALAVVVDNFGFPSIDSLAFTTWAQGDTFQSSTAPPHGMWAALQPRFEELARLDQDVLLDSSTYYSNRTGFVIFAGAKGEHATVEEWVLYHMFVGVDNLKVGLVGIQVKQPTGRNGSVWLGRLFRLK